MNRFLTVVPAISCALGISATALSQTSPVRFDAGEPAVTVVDRSVLRAAMDEQLLLGYDAAATTNRARFFAGVMLRLARDARAADPYGPPLFIQYQDWYWTYLNVLGLGADDAPISIQRVFDNKQDAMIDYNPDRIVKSVRNGTPPELAVSIQISWPGGPDAPEKYSFEDTTSNPTLRVTNHRLIRYRILDFGDMLVYDDMQGLTGRPTSGVLAALFAIIGDGHVAWSRIAITDDGLQVIRAQAKKGLFTKTETVTVHPDGRAIQGLPEESPELLAIEERLKRDFDIEYYDWVLPDMDGDE